MHDMMSSSGSQTRPWVCGGKTSFCCTSVRQKVHFIEETVSSNTLLGLMDSLPNLIPEIALLGS